MGIISKLKKIVKGYFWLVIGSLYLMRLYWFLGVFEVLRVGEPGRKKICQVK